MVHVSKLAGVFNQMKQRCRNPNNEKYYLYGARGIEVRFFGWAEFRDWSTANGYTEGLTIDRIDNNGHYEPSNCRWVTPRAQSRNLRKNVQFEAFGEIKALWEWVEDPRCTVGYSALAQRVRKCKDWTPEEMVSLPAQPNQMVRVLSVTDGRPKKPREAQRLPRKPPPTHCPAGHDYAETKRWNKRGRDYYCTECARIKGRERYRRKVGSRDRDAA